MSIIANFGTYHIEAHQITGIAVNAGSFANANFNLNRSGRFMGGMITIGSLAVEPEVTARLLTTVNAQIAFGSLVSTLRCRFENAGAGNETNANAYIIVFIQDGRA